MRNPPVLWFKETYRLSNSILLFLRLKNRMIIVHNTRLNKKYKIDFIFINAAPFEATKLKLESMIKHEKKNPYQFI